MKNPCSAAIPLSVAGFIAAAVAALMVRPVLLGLGIAVLVVAGIVVAMALLSAHHKKTRLMLDDVMRENETAAGAIIRGIGVPALMFNEAGRIIWANDALKAIYDGTDILKLVPGLNLRRPEGTVQLEQGGRNFQAVNMPVQRSNRQSRITFQYWVDRTEALHYSRLYEEQMPTVVLIYVDNYDELNSDKQFHRNTVLGEVERRVSEFATSIEGVYRRYDSAKFIVVFEAKYIEKLEQQRFQLLDAARDIDTGTGQTVTLSISVGVANRIAMADESARQGMELALGRGGDQAIVKRGTQYTFYGGKRQMTTKNSRVKARLFAKALRQMMENSERIFIMGHKHPDMDCMGAALGLFRCATMVGKPVHMVLAEPNPTIATALETMAQNTSYRDFIKTPEQCELLMRPGSVMIVVDTQREGSVIQPRLYNQAGKTVIIDHHRRSVDSLATPTLHFLEAGASSACEMVTEVLQYFDDNLRPTGFESGALLAGITLDTKHFEFNTGARTFEAASYLRRNGADNSMVKLMFQDDMQTYRSRSDVVKSAMVMEQGIAISTCPAELENSALIAAQAADELIDIKGIRASFVLAQAPGQVLVSGRSLGEINVQLILEQLGGGGHLTVAGAQLAGSSMDEAVNKLTQSIKTYLKEAQTQ